MSQLIEYNSSPSLSPISVASPLPDEIDNDNSWFIDRNPDYNIPMIINNRNYQENDYHYYNYYSNDSNYIDITNIVGIPINNFYQERVKIDVTCEVIEISEEDQNCCICMETREKEEICQFNCNHNFCELCTKLLLDKNKNLPTHPTCPLCRETIKNIKTQKNEIQNEINIKCILFI